MSGDVYSKIAEKLKKIAQGGKLSETLIIPAQVKNVSGTTCTVLIDDLEVTDVRLRAVINNEAEQVLITPKIDSYVLIADLSGGNFRDFAVISCSEVESINIKIGSTEMTIDQSGYKMERRGENLNKVLSDFVSEVMKIIVVQGTSPNVPALQRIQQRISTILS